MFNKVYKSLIKVKDHKGETNVFITSNKFHTGSTSRIKFVSSSSGTKKWKKKKKRGQGNKAKLVVAQKGKKAKVDK